MKPDDPFSSGMDPPLFIDLDGGSSGVPDLGKTIVLQIGVKRIENAACGFSPGNFVKRRRRCRIPFLFGVAGNIPSRTA